MPGVGRSAFRAAGAGCVRVGRGAPAAVSRMCCCRCCVLRRMYSAEVILTALIVKATFGCGVAPGRGRGGSAWGDGAGLAAVLRRAGRAGAGVLHPGGAGHGIDLTPAGVPIIPSVQVKQHVRTRGGCRLSGLVAGCRGGRAGRVRDRLRSWAQGCRAVRGAVGSVLVVERFELARGTRGGGRGSRSECGPGARAGGSVPTSP
jgi:hypothetical protein